MDLSLSHKWETIRGSTGQQSSTAIELGAILSLTGTASP